MNGGLFARDERETERRDIAHEARSSARDRGFRGLVLHNRGLLLGTLVLGGLWLLGGLLVVPRVIEAAYAGRGLAFVQWILADYSSRSLSFFLRQWREMVWVGAGAGAVWTGLALLLRTPRAAHRLVGRTTPGVIGMMRILVCGVLLVSALWEDLPSTAALPRDMRRFMGVMELFYLIPGFEQVAASPGALGILQGMTIGVLFLGMIGWRTRWMMPLGAVGYLMLGGLLRQYAWFYHTGLLPLYLLVVLCFLPAGDGGSIDRLRRLWRGQPVPRADRATRRYGWARYAVWATLALPYVMAGFSKLRNGGLYWWNATDFKYILFRSTLRPMEFDFEVSLLLTSAPDALVAALALTALLGELLYGLVLFSKRARWVLPGSMMVMHIGILFMQNILFFDLIVLQVIFFDLRKVRKAVGRHLAERWGRHRLLYDDTSRRQRRAVRVLRALDLFGRFEVEGMWASGAAPWAIVYQGETRETVRERWQHVARALPALWPIVPLLYLPGTARLTEHLLLGHSARKEARQRGVPRPRKQQASWVATPRLTLAVAGVLFLAWVLRVEVYPITAMQMFSGGHGPVVTYTLPKAHLRNGTVIEAPIRETIGAMADARYRQLLEGAFDPENEAVTSRFFHIVAERWNRQVPPERHVTKIVVQRWRWNYEANPEDPDHGEVVAQKVYPVRSPPARDG